MCRLESEKDNNKQIKSGKIVGVCGGGVGGGGEGRGSAGGTSKE